MKKTMILALLLALFGFSFAGTTVSVGETVPVGGTTTTTTTTTTYTEEVPTEETGEEGSTGGLGGLTLENEDGDTINVGGAEGEITPLGSGEEETSASGGTEASGSASTTFPNGGSGSPPSADSGNQQSACAPAFALLACAFAAFSLRN